MVAPGNHPRGAAAAVPEAALACPLLLREDTAWAPLLACSRNAQEAARNRGASAAHRSGLAREASVVAPLAVASPAGDCLDTSPMPFPKP